MNNISECIIPVIILMIFLRAYAKKIPVFSSFTKGAKTGIKTIFEVFPSLLALVTAIEILEVSGLLQLFTKLLHPFFRFLKIPDEISHLVLIKPISGSGSIAVFQNIIEKYSADSFLGICAAVITGSTETTLYTLAVYFAATKVTNTRHTAICALLADLICVITACFICRLIFN